ncbi:hypothetical protein EAW52_23065 [Pseudomonas sp. LTJR-52]|nr:hypothetical protein EAW52_23065 [Pseudomonas sp. LTJR-52]
MFLIYQSIRLLIPEKFLFDFPFCHLRETDSGCFKAKGSLLKAISIRKQSKGSHAVKGFHGENCGFTQRSALLSQLLISLCSTVVYGELVVALWVSISTYYRSLL